MGSFNEDVNDDGGGETSLLDSFDVLHEES